MKEQVAVRVGWIVVLGAALVACEREAPVQAPAGAKPAAVASAPQPPRAVELEDVIETTSDYIVGISYPKVASKYPGLAAELRRYAEGARTELLEAVKQRKATPDAPPYDLTLSFTTLHESPALVAIAADGSRYTGGAHGEPLIARFVWLPQDNRLLTAAELVPDAASWNAIATDVREQLHAALSQRIDADALPPADRARMIRDAGAMIDEGTAPDAQHFSMFEPVVTAQGSIGALRFVFPPYQVGPYADGTQTVEVPAEVLLPHVAPQYRRLFAGGAG